MYVPEGVPGILVEDGGTGLHREKVKLEDVLMEAALGGGSFTY